jgi:hypothetical protein
MQLHDRFESVDAAREAIRRYVLDNGESFKLVKSDKKRFSICCKDQDCGFWIRAAQSSKGVVSITRFKLHTCSPVVHYNKNKQAHSVSYLSEHHCAAIIDNRKITAAQIQSNKRLQFNEIGYMLAYQTIQAVLTEMYSDKAESFAQFPAFVERYHAAD